MRMSLIPESIPAREISYLRENGSASSQVQRLVTQMDRETQMIKGGKAIIQNAEEFPNHIHFNSSERLRRLLDII